MALTKRNNIYWLDIRINGVRFRRSLRTTIKGEALHKFGKVKDDLKSQYSGKKLRFDDFCKQYMEWAWSSKPASAPREQQRLRKIQDFFQGLEIVYLDEITPYHIEQLKAELKERKLSRATINRYLQLLRGLFYRAIDWEIYRKPNPLKKIRFYKEERSTQVLSGNDLSNRMRLKTSLRCLILLSRGYFMIFVSWP